MNWKMLHTIEGGRDYFDEELDKKISLERGLLASIRDEGYRRIETPSLEYFDLFSKENGSVSSKDLFKVDDREGNTMALRPDLTPSVARCAVMYFDTEQYPLRICYKGNTFVNHNRYKGHLAETTQIGAELMGTLAEADAEIIGVAVKALKDNGAEDFRINIGHSRFFRALLSEANIAEDDCAHLYELMSGRNYFGLIKALAEAGADKGILEAASCLNEVCSSREALAEASKKAAAYQGLKSVFDELLRLYDRLYDLGIADHIAYDLGFTGKRDYYTGIVFAGYMPGRGATVLMGGRYDNLLASFGKKEPAVGFVIDVNTLLEAMEFTEPKSSKEGYLTFALGKGRLAKSAMALLERIGLSCDEVNDESTRKLIFVNEETKTRYFLAKGPDVPTYVEYGAADIGIVGEDTILEEDREAYEVIDLGFGKCRMCVCGPKSAQELLDSRSRIRVATKYPHIARDYFYNIRHRNVEIIKLNGSVELAPIVGLSDVIVDIVETGSTLKENGLVILEEVCPLSARLIINKASMQTQHERIRKLICGLHGLLEEK